MRGMTIKERLHTLIPHKHPMRGTSGAQEGALAAPAQAGKLVEKDHEEPAITAGPAAPKGDISAIFALFDSGRSDVSSNVEKHLGESLWQEHLRETGQSGR